MAPWKERLIRVVALITLAYSIYYVVWRWGWTLNPDALWFSIPLVVAETWGLLTSFFLIFTTWKLKRREPRPAPAGLSVDVFITTYDEPLEVIRRTALGAREIRYPHRTYVLDDGKREEVREMAEELGIGYIRREGNEHAKAGNLNHALGVTEGEFFLQLDADHVPLPYILDRLLGFFDDPRVAFVQSPQDFYNTDSFTHDINEEGRRMWEEQRIFFSLIQPGKDYWNAAFFCGSCGVIRRSALDEIGGFSVETITEDMETSILLHARGWKSVYYGESLAYGLAPGSAGAFHVQRLRWGQGSMQIWRKFKPLTHRGLTLPQRIAYFSSVASYLDGFQKLIFYLAPILFFLTGVFPIRVDNTEFLIRFVPHLVLSLATFELLSRGTGYLWIAERFNMAKFFTYMLAVTGYFARGKLKFNVTPKGAGHVPFKTYAPQLFLAILSVAATVWAILAYELGWIDYSVPGWESLAFWLNFVWLLWNFGLAVYVVQLSLYVHQQRADHRFVTRFPVRVCQPGVDGELTALADDLNSSGIHFRSAAKLEPGKSVRLALQLTSGTVEAEAKVLHRKRTARAGVPIYRYGAEFGTIAAETGDAIEMHCIHHAVPLWQLQHRRALDLFALAAEWSRNSRRERRQRVHLPVELSDRNGRPHHGFLEDVSARGARLVLEYSPEPGEIVSYHIPGTEIAGEGRVVFSRALETPLGVRFAVGLQRQRLDSHTITDNDDLRYPKTA